jgi:hypothetical protein
MQMQTSNCVFLCINNFHLFFACMFFSNVHTHVYIYIHIFNRYIKSVCLSVFFFALNLLFVSCGNKTLWKILFNFFVFLFFGHYMCSMPNINVSDKKGKRFDIFYLKIFSLFQKIKRFTQCSMVSKLFC